MILTLAMSVRAVGLSMKRSQSLADLPRRACQAKVRSKTQL